MMKKFSNYLNGCRFGLGALCLAHSLAFASEEVAAKPELSWNGDFRFRHEWVFLESAAVQEYNHQRIRARLGLKVAFPDAHSLEFRLATGSGGVSTNQTLGASASSFKNYDFKLDRAAYHLKLSESTYFRTGRMANPFSSVGDNDLVWDGDLNFDGIAALQDFGSDSFNSSLGAGFFWIDKNASTPKSDVTLASLQSVSKIKMTDSLDVALAMSYHDYKGRSVDFNLAEVGLELKVPVSEIPLRIFANVAKNTVSSVQDLAYLAGFRWGQLKAKGDWSLAYDYRKVEANAVVSTFSDGDSFGGSGVDGWSHRVTAAYQVSTYMNLGGAYYLGEKSISTNPRSRNRVQLDLNVKF